jgi:soluble lytic murein transglycosylase-like protein
MTNKWKYAAGGFFLTALSWLSLTSLPKKAKASMAHEPDLEDAKNAAFKYSKVFNVPSRIIMTILAVESRFNANAVNRSERAMKRGGAWGIGQMSLQTAKDLTNRFPMIASVHWKKFDGTGESLLDVSTNVSLVAFYLSMAWRRYKGNELATLLSYHQGVGTIDKLIADKRNWNDKLPPFGKEYLVMLNSQLPRFEAYA